jgi:hypothetical protein
MRKGVHITHDHLFMMRRKNDHNSLAGVSPAGEIEFKRFERFEPLEPIALC